MIEGLSNRRRLPRLGKIHLGYKKMSQKTGKAYPVATDYFVCPDGVMEVYGDKPKSLQIIFPSDDPDRFAPQFYKVYSETRGKTCQGDGVKANQLVDKATGQLATRNSKDVEWREVPCLGQKCPHYQAKKCRPVMNLQFLLPDCPGLGVYQLDTSSINSIININSAVELISGIAGQVSMIPLELAIEPQEVSPDGKKKTVHVLNLRLDKKLTDIKKLMAPRLNAWLPEPEEPEEIIPFDETEADWPGYRTGDADPDTGEVINGNGPQQKPDFLGNEPDPAIQDSGSYSHRVEAPASPEDEQTEMPMSIKNKGDLFTVCFKLWGMNKSQVLKELGFTDDIAISDATDAFQQIKAIKEGVESGKPS